MSLDYSAIQSGLETVKMEIDNLVDYIKANQSRPDTGSVDLDIYAQLAEISTKLLECDRSREDSPRQFEQFKTPEDAQGSEKLIVDE